MTSRAMTHVFMLWMLVIFASPGYADKDVAAIAFTPDHAYAYVGQLSATQIQLCTLTSKGQLDHCQVTGPTSFIMPTRLALAPQGHYLYAIDLVYHTVFKCSINTVNNQLLECNALRSVPEDVNDIAIEAQGRYVYMTHAASLPSVSICSINALGEFQDCHAGPVAIKQPNALALNAAGKHAYVLSNQAKTLWSCMINSSDGLFHACTTMAIDKEAGFLPRAKAMAHNIYATGANLNNEDFITACEISESGDMVYSNQYPDGSSFRCSINQNTADFKACFGGGNPLSDTAPLNMIVNAKSTHLYIYSAGLLRLKCALGSNGAVTSCTRIDHMYALPWEDMTP